MEVAVLSICAPEDLQLVAELRRSRENVHLIKIVPDREGESASPFRFSRKPLHALYHAVASRFYRWQALRQQSKTRKRLENSIGPSPVIADFEVAESQVNGIEMAAILDRISPDYIIVSGAPLLKRHIFGKAKRASINVHQGIVPHYRGGHTNWWPLFFRDYENVGVSLHYIDEGLDTGNLIAHGYCGVDQKTDEADLAFKSAEMAAGILVDFLDRQGEVSEGSRPLGGVKQTDQGRVFRYADRRLWHDLTYGFRRTFGLDRIPTTHSRVVRYYA